MGLLTGKYKYAVETAKGFNLDGTTEERNGKLFIKGTVKTQEQYRRGRQGGSRILRRHLYRATGRYAEQDRPASSR